MKKILLLGVLLGLTSAVACGGGGDGSSGDGDGDAASTGATGATGGTSTGGAGAGTGGADSGTGGSSPAMLGKNMLVYYGDGGIPPNTLYADYQTYDHWEQAVTPLGGSFFYTDQWPMDLSSFKVVTLVHPGANNGGLPLPDATVFQLRTWIEGGGTFFLLGDIYLDPLLDAQVTFNQLTADLGIPVQLGTEAAGVGEVLLLDATHPLASMATSLECSGFNDLVYAEGLGVQRVDLHEGEPKLVAYPMGLGAAVLISDGQCLDRGRGDVITAPELGFLTSLMNWPQPMPL